MTERISIIIADDHPIVRDALKSLIKNHGMDVVCEAENGQEVIECLQKTKCDLLILDMSMPGHPAGHELIRMITESKTKVPPILIFSMSHDGWLALTALESGASGYVTKDSDPIHIVEAIRKLVTGNKYICPSIAEQIFLGNTDEGTEKPPHKSLSKREFQIFLLLLDGKSMEEIAEELCISRQTVGTHKMRIMNKLGLKSNIDIVRYALRHGLTSI